MRKQRRQETKTTIDLRLWTQAEAVRAVPYLRSIVRSLREHWLEARQALLQAQRIDARPGPRDRNVLLLRADADREAKLAQDRVTETLGELQAVGVNPLDPAAGLALIPFQKGEDLAWFVFDLFSPEGVHAWRFHADPLETRRPLPARSAPALTEKLSAFHVDQLMSETTLR